MSITIRFGNQRIMSCRRATMRTITASVQSAGAKSVLLAEKFSPRCVIWWDADGGWAFDDLDLASAHELAEILAKLESQLPGAIANWNRERVAVFYRDFEQFRKLLAERIYELQSATS